MKNRSLTLIELLVAISIFSIVAIVIYSTFTTGIIGWKKGEAAISLFHEIRLGMDMISREIRNQVPYNGVRFVGKADELYFISSIPFPEEGEEEYRRLAKIRYFLKQDKDRLMLFRERRWFPYVEGTSEDTDTTKLLSDMRALAFQYGEKEGDTLVWNDTWQNTERWPVAVKIDLSIGGEVSQSLAKVIYLPYREYP